MSCSDYGSAARRSKRINASSGDCAALTNGSSLTRCCRRLRLRRQASSVCIRYYESSPPRPPDASYNFGPPMACLSALPKRSRPSASTTPIFSAEQFSAAHCLLPPHLCKSRLQSSNVPFKASQAIRHYLRQCRQLHFGPSLQIRWLRNCCLRSTIGSGTCIFPPRTTGTSQTSACCQSPTSLWLDLRPCVLSRCFIRWPRRWR